MWQNSGKLHLCSLPMLELNSVELAYEIHIHNSAVEPYMKLFFSPGQVTTKPIYYEI